MILTDYLRAAPDPTWAIAAQCGVRAATIRLPEDPAFDPADFSQCRAVVERFERAGFRPLVVEPLPNCLHDHIKAGDEKRDECLEKALKLIENMGRLGIGTLCFNFMAHVGWTRTASDLPERGGAKVTGFRMNDYQPSSASASVSAAQLWKNYEIFLRAAVPQAARFGVRLALHPDDPPLPALGGVERIFISYENIRRAVREIVPSEFLGLTFCQATFHLMGEDLFRIIPALADKIFFVHFRNIRGTKTDFRETFHDNGDLPMARLLRLYRDCGVDVPIRIDHVPTLRAESVSIPGYDAQGRLFAIGYLKGILEAEGAERSL